MRLKELLIENIKLLKENNIEDGAIIARELLAYTIEKDKQYLLINENMDIDSMLQLKYEKFIHEIINGKPLQYITNKQEFMKLNFYVDENVLIPQPDTEILVENVIKICNEKSDADTIKILDLCTGSGAIAISLYNYIKIPNKQIYASDISKKAIEVAKKNSYINNAKIEFIESNMFENIKYKDFDIIVSNPPYIERNIIPTLPKDVLAEPIIALDGGKDGTDFYKIIAENAYKYIRNNGYLCLEIGYNQKDAVTNILESTKKYKDIKAIKDLSNNYRCIIATINDY